MRRIWFLFRVAVVLFVWLICGYALNQWEYFSAFWDIDNIVGMLPFVMALFIAIGAAFLSLAAHRKERLPLTVVTAALVFLSVVLYPAALRGNWWIDPVMYREAEAQPDLDGYTPFSEGSLTAKLDTQSDLLLTENLPVLDGATALYPVYAAFAEAVYSEAAYSPDLVLCGNTHGAYEALLSGDRDIIFIAGASVRQAADAGAAGADLRFVPIGREAFVFLVGRDNPLDGITYQQIRNIYSGKTAFWGTLGWKEGGRIVAFQRPEGSGSQTGLQTIMGGIPIQVPQPLPDAGLVGSNSLMRQVSVRWQGVQPAIGYSYRYFATVMYANPEAKLLKINGIEPSVENIQNGTYPFIGNFYAVTNGEPEGNVRRLIDWILSSQGQEIIRKTGYVPLR